MFRLQTPATRSVYVSKEETLVTEERKINNSREKRKVVFRALCTKPLGECLHLSALERAITYVHRFIKPVETVHVIRAQILASTAASCLPIFSRCYGFVNAYATETLEIRIRRANREKNKAGSTQAYAVFFVFLVFGKTSVASEPAPWVGRHASGSRAAVATKLGVVSSYLLNIYFYDFRRAI